jgi:ABC-type branched-subunit amino acid transport system substrate-binding protein
MSIIIACFVIQGFLVACSPTFSTQESEKYNTDSMQEDFINGEDYEGNNLENDYIDDIPDLTGETIVLHLIGDTTLPFTSITSPVRNAALDYIGYLNENGGLFGATVELRFADTGGSEEGVVTAYERYANDDDPIWLLINYGGFEGSLYELVKRDRIPLITFGLNPDIQDIDKNGYVYRLSPTYDEQFVFFIDYILENWEEIKPDGVVDEIKVAYFGWDNEYGRSGLTKETREYVEDLGIEIVWEEYLEMSELSSSTDAIFNAQIMGATVIYSNTHEYGPAKLLNDLNNLAIRDFFVVGGNHWAFDTGMLEYLYDPGFAENFFTPSWHAWWTDKENAGIQIAEQILEANGRTDADKMTGRLLIQGGLDLACYAIEQAIINKGDLNISGVEIKKTLDEISDYEVMNGLFSVNFSDGARSPSFLQMRKVLGNDSLLVTIEQYSEIPDF